MRLLHLVRKKNIPVLFVIGVSKNIPVAHQEGNRIITFGVVLCITTTVIIRYGLDLYISPWVDHRKK